MKAYALLLLPLPLLAQTEFHNIARANQRRVEVDTVNVRVTPKGVSSWVKFEQPKGYRTYSGEPAATMTQRLIADCISMETALVYVIFHRPDGESISEATLERRPPDWEFSEPRVNSPEDDHLKYICRLARKRKLIE